MELSRLIHMANQIAANFAVQGEDQAVAATAAHIHDFWDPRMKSAILAGSREGLVPIAGAAIEQLAASHISKSANA